ncbi:hypothetical protein H920_12802 [Fukomys damarensis]|uniref:Uncharacterized protein n=1 Tax=Fukomys damarensis TaxID=885580 RepID=A0A091D1A3_FUKDA|nr:hypothetical protein H920_12802 [Fukomys damarensis]
MPCVKLLHTSSAITLLLFCEKSGGERKSNKSNRDRKEGMGPSQQEGDREKDEIPRRKPLLRIEPVPLQPLNLQSTEDLDLAEVSHRVAGSQTSWEKITAQRNQASSSGSKSKTDMAEEVGSKVVKLELETE